MLKKVILMCAITATLSADNLTKDRDTTVVSLGPSHSFLKVRKARQRKNHGNTNQLSKIFSKQKSESNKMNASDTARLTTFFAGALSGTALSYFFPTAAKTTFIPLTFFVLYLLMGGKLPTGSLFEGVEDLYRLIRVLEKCSAHKQVAQLRNVLDSPKLMNNAHFSSLLGQFLHQAEELLAQKDISKQEMGEQLAQLLKSHRTSVESWARKAEIASLFVITTAASAAITLSRASTQN